LESYRDKDHQNKAFHHLRSYVCYLKLVFSEEKLEESALLSHGAFTRGAAKKRFPKHVFSTQRIIRESVSFVWRLREGSVGVSGFPHLVTEIPW